MARPILLPALQETIKRLPIEAITQERKKVLKHLIDYIQTKILQQKPVLLNFICTHNSRRSQFAQIWALTAAYIYGKEVQCFSGGVEETAFNKRAVAALTRAGFMIIPEEGNNPVYRVTYADGAKVIKAFSKMYDNPVNPTTGFAAVMTCSDADENCPYIPGTEQRIPLLYDDPKEFDGTNQEASKYDERSTQIGSEMFYVFSKIN